MKTTKCRVICIYMPKPEILEGFDYDMEYQAEICEGEKKYVRLFPENSPYYEICSMIVFHKHFKMVKTCHCKVPDEAKVELPKNLMKPA